MLAITPDHQELAQVVRSFLEDRGARRHTRSLLEDESPALPPFWKEFGALGWLGLHVPEGLGGQGAGYPELAVFLDELGGAVAPGPVLSTVIVSAFLSEVGVAPELHGLVSGLCDGSEVGGLALHGGLAYGDGRATGEVPLVLGGELATALLIPAGEDVVLLRKGPGMRVEPRLGIDPGMQVGRLVADGAEVTLFPADLSRLRRIGRMLAAAEAAGGTHACTAMAVEYAKVRVQFGRPIGSFQAVKHHCANMLVDAERATAVAWDAARAPAADERQAVLSAATAVAIGLPAYLACAKRNIQVHGGIGFTWEHDAHLHLRRASALAALFGPSDQACEEIEGLAADGARRELRIELPPEAETVRVKVRAFRNELEKRPQSQWHEILMNEGYIVPHWPRPFGRDAGPVEQLVIDEELAGIDRGGMGLSWVVLTLITHGSPDQLERLVGPSIKGQMSWCQLFSEPNAGSDAANVQTRGVRTDGGWIVNGQKVWTSGGLRATHGFATVRTDRDAEKHAGITTMVIDMKGKGVEVRGLRQISGDTNFAEVFLADVFVPDDDVVGPVNGGWTVARGTLGNERLSIGGMVMRGGGAERLIVLAGTHAPEDDRLRREIGALVAEELVVQVMNLRAVTRVVAGGQRGPEGNVTKLVTSETAQRVAEAAMAILGVNGAAADGAIGHEVREFLHSRMTTIGGGTSEIARNQIAERILGLPRERSTF